MQAQALYFLSVLPAAVPGMVLGLGYIFAFNAPGNPLEWLYGGLLILALCNVYHYHAQGYLIATTASGQISRVFDETSTCLGATRMRTLRAVLLPLIAPAIASIAVFFFVPFYYLVVGVGERPFTDAWFLSQEERQRYKPFAKRMLLWLVAAAAVGGIWSLVLNAMGVQQ